MKLITILSLLFLSKQALCQVILAEVESAVQVNFQEILLISVNSTITTHYCAAPNQAGKWSSWPDVPPVLNLRFTCTPAAQNRFITVEVVHALPVQLQINGVNLPNIQGTQLVSNFPLPLASSPKQILEISKGGCTGNGPSDGVIMELVGNLTGENYELVRAGNHQINLTWTVL